MASAERWVPVPGHEGIYEVSDLGRVRSVPRVATHRNGSSRRVDGKIRRLVPNGRYLKVQLSTADGSRRTHWVHRLVLLAFVGDAPGMNACHGNGDGRDNRLVNLRWDTPHENQMDKTRHGTNRQALKTHCPRRHPLVAPNLASGVNGRSCRACANERSNAHQAGRAFDPVRADERYRLLTVDGRAVEVEGASA